MGDLISQPPDSAQGAATLPGRLETHLGADAVPSASWMLRLGEGVTGEKTEKDPSCSCSRSLISYWRGGGRGRAANFRQSLYE